LRLLPALRPVLRRLPTGTAPRRLQTALSRNPCSPPHRERSSCPLLACCTSRRWLALRPCDLLSHSNALVKRSQHIPAFSRKIPSPGVSPPRDRRPPVRRSKTADLATGVPGHQSRLTGLHRPARGVPSSGLRLTPVPARRGLLAMGFRRAAPHRPRLRHPAH